MIPLEDLKYFEVVACGSEYRTVIRCLRCDWQVHYVPGGNLFDMALESYTHLVEEHSVR